MPPRSRGCRCPHWYHPEQRDCYRPRLPQPHWPPQERCPARRRRRRFFSLLATRASGAGSTLPFFSIFDTICVRRYPFACFVSFRSRLMGCRRLEVSYSPCRRLALVARSMEIGIKGSISCTIFLLCHFGTAL